MLMNLMVVMLKSLEHAFPFVIDDTLKSTLIKPNTEYHNVKCGLQIAAVGKIIGLTSLNKLGSGAQMVIFRTRSRRGSKCARNHL